jgi:hypothetical protein
VSGSPDALDRVRAAAEDLRGTGRIDELVMEPAEGPLAATVELAEDPAA